MRIPVSDTERPFIVRFAITFAGIIIGWAMLNDVILASIEPRHFTEYHRPLLPISNHSLLAAQYATVATFGPGLVFGYLAYLACRFGKSPKRGLRCAALGFASVILAIEPVLMGVGYYARGLFMSRGTTLYPESFYPELTPGIIFSQSVNVSATLFAPIAGAVYLLVIFYRRNRRSRL